MATLAEIRARLQAQETRQSGSSNVGDNAIYPHWNIQENETSVLRFLPDGNASNTFFWAERQMIRLPFQGIKNEVDSKPTTVQVPCMEMWEPTGSCPVLAEVRPWFKDASLEEQGRKYWKKRSYIFQGFVVQDPMNEETPENPIRRFVIGPQIFKLLKAALMDPDMENLPTDYDAGTDFRLTKTQKGQYADYSTSNWARKERSLNEEERQAIETNGLFDLNEFMPKRPSQDELNVIMEMFEASVDGELYDPERWGNFYKPYGLEVPETAVKNSSSGASSAPTPKASPAPVTAPTPTAAPAPTVSEDDIPFKSNEEVEAEAVTASADAGGAGKDASDILAMIRARKTD